MSETIFLQNGRLKLGTAGIFGYLPAQVAQVYSPGFPVPWKAPTYRDVKRQSNRLC